MPRSNTVNIYKLQQALNSKGCRILYGTTQFWSEAENRPVRIYQVSQMVYDEATDKYKKVKIYESASQIQIVLFLRDMWNEINGLPEDTSNEYWNEIKRRNNGE